ncbi:MAG TPA: hypothetical protein VKA34_17780 [Balneolales bacterium]|nr:hypothetical protein [Balneolales bacterium]
MVKRTIFISIVLGAVLLIGSNAKAQLVKDLHSPLNNTGDIVKKPAKKGFNLLNIANVRMHQSLEMSFASFGGHYMNQNIFTNSMFLDFSPRLTGRLDVSIANSPFGGGFVGGRGKNNVKIFIRNADLNYKLGKNSDISIHFSQNPYGYGYYGSPFGNPYRYGYGNGFDQFGYYGNSR